MLALAATACGKKGPPLTPFVRVPAAPTVGALRRVGNEVYVAVTVPAANMDGFKPASVSRILVFAATAATPPPRARFFEIATLIATIPVAPAGDPADAVPTPQDPAAGALQGATVMVRDRLSKDALMPRELVQTADERRTAALTLPATAPAPRVIRRFYLALAVNARGVNGPASDIAALPLTVIPEPPAALRVTVTRTAAVLAWEPSGGLIGWLVDRAMPVETLLVPVEPRPGVAPAVPPPPGPSTYNVYRETAPDPLVMPDARTQTSRPWEIQPPASITAAPLAPLTFSDPIELDEQERCYTVRTLRGGVEGEPSPRVCVTPHDIYPPAPPTGVSAAAAEAQILVFWDSNTEPDLGGYLVLRRAAGSATLLPLTPAPITDTRFVDRDVMPGVEYSYVVVAVDTRLPLPNMSLPSTEASDTVR